MLRGEFMVSLTVASTPGQGSVFSMRLKLVEEGGEAQPLLEDPEG